VQVFSSKGQRSRSQDVKPRKFVIVFTYAAPADQARQTPTAHQTNAIVRPTLLSAPETHGERHERCRIKMSPHGKSAVRRNNHGINFSLPRIKMSPPREKVSPSLKFRCSRRDTIAPSEEVSPTRDRLLDDDITHTMSVRTISFF